MSRRRLIVLVCLSALTAAAWFGAANYHSSSESWARIVPGVLKCPGYPAGYALVDGDAALLIDAPHRVDGLKQHGIKKIEQVLLTHHHRDTCAQATFFVAQGVPVRAPKSAAEWLSAENVRKYWRESLPLRNSRAAYLVVPVGVEVIEFALADGQTIEWRGWSIQVIAAPGHSRDHVAFAVRKGKPEPLLLFCGDALCVPGKLWTPYTTDWDHWTDAGLTPTAETLRKLARLKPAMLLPAHGPVIANAAVEALNQTATAVETMAFLKSFERFTKQRLGNAPEYRFLAKEQVATAGEKPWTQVSEHLYLTGNTYVLTSKDNAFLVMDPWGKRSADQIAKLVAERKLGPLEVVMFSHAHYDHYDGIYELPARDHFQVWTLDQVAPPIADPGLLRAPFLDPRPVKIDRQFRDGDTANWREYSFRFHHFPGQSEFTMGVQTTIDGKQCFFTADNFFHQDQFSGSGGWMGLNRSYPLPYADSAQKVLTAAPQWVLAEHGGPFEFNAEDFRRRVQWGQVSATAADAICPSGNHRYDWDPHRVHVEPILQKARRGAALKGMLVVSNPLPRKEKLTILLEGRGLVTDQSIELEVAANETAKREISCRVNDKTPPGRHAFVLQVTIQNGLDGTDAVLVIDVER